MSKRLWILFSCIYTFLAVLACLLLSFHEASEISFGIDFLNGPANHYYAPLEMVWWLFLFTPVWAVCGWLLDMSTRLSSIEIYRYRNSALWWLGFVVRIYGVQLWYFGILYVIMMIKIPDLVNMQVMLSLLLHSGVMSAAMIWIWLCFGKINTAIIVIIIAEALAKLPVLAGLPPKVNPLVWGMYGYCKDVYGPQGFVFGISVTIQVFFILATALIPFYLKKLILRGVSFERK